MTAQGQKLVRLERLSKRVVLLHRADRAFRAMGAMLPFVLLVAIAALGAIKVWRPGPAAEVRLLVLPLVPLTFLCIAVALACTARLPALLGAVRLDRHYGLKGKLTNALSFAAVAEGELTPMQKLAIADALAIDVSALRARAACPIQAPPRIALSSLLVVALCVLATLEVRERRALPPVPHPLALLVSEDDLDLLQDWAADTKHTVVSGENSSTTSGINQLIEDLAARRLDRQEALRRLAALEHALIDRGGTDLEGLDESLDRLAKELGSSRETRPTAEAMRQRKLDDAASALEKLAQSLDAKRPPSKEQLERLRQSLQRASEARTRQFERIQPGESDLEKERKRLLKRAQEKTLDAPEQQRLDAIERRLQKLDRHRSESKSSAEALTPLERELAKAAGELMKDLGLSARDLQSGAQDLRKLGQRRTSIEQQRKLLERLRQLRDMLRQRESAGSGRQQRLRRFGRSARGLSPNERSEGKVKPAQREGEPTLIVGETGSPAATMPVEVPGARSRADSATDEPTAASRGTRGRGDGSDPKVAGESSSVGGALRDVTAVAQDTGQGSASSEVIEGAAERGFLGRDYQDVYVAYENVAERALEADRIPPGYKSYVRRYFQLIRPRD